ncbi:MAG TPA: HAMP domain-containing sensor histidine kinase [Polyangiaceae bacterium]|nr:HAMP domain-containing sensor histidine kinase [Polyangiaceae bacterium]
MKPHGVRGGAFHPHESHRRGRGRLPLQRQLFIWLAVTIVVTALAVGLVFGFAAFHRGAATFSGRFEAMERFVAERYAEVWYDPARRRALSLSLGRALGIGVRVQDAAGATLESVGRCARVRHSFEIVQGGKRLGRVHGCLDEPAAVRPLVGVGVVLVVALVLWVAAARLARVLTRPLSALIAVTREIGSGNLKSRVRLGRHTRGELGLLAEAVNDMAERIERQIQEQRELLAVVSHEVRSPLARLRVSSEILRGDAKNQTALAAIEREVAEIDALVGKLLATARLDFGSLSRTPLDLAQLSQTVLERRGLPLSLLEDDAEGARCTGDPTLIARALDNLLDNAERHASGAVALRVRRALPSEHSRPEEALVLEVRDAGAGFDPALLPRAFDAFYSGSRVREERHASLGLGLSLVRRIAEAHGGRAWARNLADGGACVSFSIG